MSEKQRETVLVAVPKELAESVKRFVEGVVAATPDTGGGKAVDYAVFERSVEERVAELERDAHRRLLQRLDIDEPHVLIRGKAHSRVGRYEGSYQTKAGSVTIERSLYRNDEERNGATVDAVSLRTGAVGAGWLPGAAKAMAYLLQQGTTREAEKTAEQLGRLPYSRSSFESVGHAVGALYEVLHAEIEDVLIERYQVPAAVRSITAGIDRVSVPMEEPLKRPVGRPRKGAAKNPVARNFRMAYVGTVTLNDEKGEALHTIRYGRMPQGDAEGLCRGIAADMTTLLAKHPGLALQTLADGAAEMRTLLRSHINEDTHGKEVFELVDFGHVIQKLSPAAQVMFGAEYRSALARWKLRLLNLQGAAWNILAELNESGKEHQQVGDSQPVHEAITYITNNGEMMQYLEARKRGFPIGSGNTEATCKSLFEVRFKRCGSRWKEETGSHVVHLRAVALSDRWDDGIDVALKELRAPVRAA